MWELVYIKLQKGVFDKYVMGLNTLLKSYSGRDGHIKELQIYLQGFSD